MITVIFWESVSKNRSGTMLPIRLDDICHCILCIAAILPDTTGTVQTGTESEIMVILGLA